MTSLVFRSSLSDETSQQIVHDANRFTKKMAVAKGYRKRLRPWKKKGKLTLAEEKPCSLGIRVFIGHLMQELGQLRRATEELGKKGGV
jgi:hypothetical protein